MKNKFLIKLVGILISLMILAIPSISKASQDEKYLENKEIKSEEITVEKQSIKPIYAYGGLDVDTEKLKHLMILVEK